MPDFSDQTYSAWLTCERFVLAGTGHVLEIVTPDVQPSQVVPVSLCCVVTGNEEPITRLVYCEGYLGANADYLIIGRQDGTVELVNWNNIKNLLSGYGSENNAEKETTTIPVDLTLNSTMVPTLSGAVTAFGYRGPIADIAPCLYIGTENGSCVTLQVIQGQPKCQTLTQGEAHLGRITCIAVSTSSNFAANGVLALGYQNGQVDGWTSGNSNARKFVTFKFPVAHRGDYVGPVDCLFWDEAKEARIHVKNAGSDKILTWDIRSTHSPIQNLDLGIPSTMSADKTVRLDANRILFSTNSGSLFMFHLDGSGTVDVTGSETITEVLDMTFMSNNLGKVDGLTLLRTRQNGVKWKYIREIVMMKDSKATSLDRINSPVHQVYTSDKRKINYAACVSRRRITLTKENQIMIQPGAELETDELDSTQLDKLLKLADSLSRDEAMEYCEAESITSTKQLDSLLWKVLACCFKPANLREVQLRELFEALSGSELDLSDPKAAKEFFSGSQPIPTPAAGKRALIKTESMKLDEDAKLNQGTIRQSLIMGDTARAVNMALDEELFAEALIISHRDPQLWASTVATMRDCMLHQDADFRQTTMYLAQALDSQDLESYIEELDIAAIRDEWHYVILALITYYWPGAPKAFPQASLERFSDLAALYGQKMLEQQSDMQEQALCAYLLAGRLEKIEELMEILHPSTNNLEQCVTNVIFSLMARIGLNISHSINSPLTGSLIQKNLLSITSMMYTQSHEEQAKVILRYAGVTNPGPPFSQISLPSFAEVGRPVMSFSQAGVQQPAAFGGVFNRPPTGAPGMVHATPSMPAAPSFNQPPTFSAAQSSGMMPGAPPPPPMSTMPTAPPPPALPTQTRPTRKAPPPPQPISSDPQRMNVPPPAMMPGAPPPMQSGMAPPSANRQPPAPTSMPGAPPPPPISSQPTQQRQAPPPQPMSSGMPPAPQPMSSGMPPAPQPMSSGMPSAPQPMSSGMPPAPQPMSSGMPPAPQQRSSGMPPAPQPMSSGMPPAPQPMSSGMPPAPRPMSGGMPPAAQPMSSGMPPAPQPMSSGMPPAPQPMSSGMPPAPQPMSSGMPPAPQSMSGDISSLSQATYHTGSIRTDPTVVGDPSLLRNLPQPWPLPTPIQANSQVVQSTHSVNTLLNESTEPLAYEPDKTEMNAIQACDRLFSGEALERWQSVINAARSGKFQKATITSLIGLSEAIVAGDPVKAKNKVTELWKNAYSKENKAWLSWLKAWVGG